MKTGILGTGMVGETLAVKLISLGHDVTMGTRDPQATLARTKDDYGNPSFSEWLETNPRVTLRTFYETAEAAELIINATSGLKSLSALKLAGAVNMAGKILIDIANPLDFSEGMPPSLGIMNKDSLGEQIQKAFPETKVVKALNTVSAPVMVNPSSVGNGDHHIFICGNDGEAKKEVSDLLRKGFGWKNIIDMGDITNARGTEMLLPIWVRLYGKFQSPMFNFKIVQ